MTNYERCGRQLEFGIVLTIVTIGLTAILFVVIALLGIEVA